MRSQSPSPVQGPALISRTKHWSVVSAHVWKMLGNHLLGEQSQSLHLVDARASGHVPGLACDACREVGTERSTLRTKRALVMWSVLGQKTPGVTTKDSNGDLT